MTDHTSVKRRKELWKSILPTVRSGEGGTWAGLATTQTKQLQAAARFFEVDIANPVDAAALLRILADVVSTEEAPGGRNLLPMAFWGNPRGNNIGLR